MKYCQKILVERAINSALESLIKYDYYLLQFDVNERSISHKFANYLEPYFPTWHIDCEYNRDESLSSKPSKKFNPKKLNISPRNVMSDDIHGTTVFPYIIIHRRGTIDNFVAIEMKKINSTEDDDQYDRDKLLAFRSQLGYMFAIFIKIGTGAKLGINNIEWV